MAGDDVCYYKPWWEMRHPSEAEPSSPQLARWQMDHTALVTRYANGLVGGEIFREDYIALDSPPVSGKIDLAHTAEGYADIFEMKSGKKSHSHYVQLLLYLFLANRANRFPNLKLRGHLVYEDSTSGATLADVPEDFSERITVHTDPLLSEAPPRKIRNQACRYCPAECEFAARRATDAGSSA